MIVESVSERFSIPIPGGMFDEIELTLGRRTYRMSTSTAAERNPSMIGARA